MLKYTKDHEWLRMDGDVVTVGITPYAQDKLGDLVFVELPSVGAKFDMGAAAATVESVKAAAEVYAPVTGEIVAINDRVVSEPELVNSDPIGDGWLFKIKPSKTSELAALLDEEAYKTLTG